MTKITTILASALIATSAIAISANASVNFTGEDAGDLTVKIGRSSAAPQVFVSDSESIFTAKGNKPVMSATATKNPGYKGKTWTVDTTKPLEVVAKEIHTLNSTKSKEDLAKTVDVTTYDVMSELLAYRKNIAIKSKVDLEAIQSLLTDLHAAYNAVHAQQGYLFTAKTDKDYWTALKAAHDKHAKPAVEATESEIDEASIDVYNLNPAISEMVAKKAISLGSTRELDVFTKKDLHQEMRNTIVSASNELDQNNVREFNSLKADTYAILTQKVAINMASLSKADKLALGTKGKAHKITHLSEDVGALLDAAVASPMWAKYVSILNGTALYNTPAPVVETADSAPTLVATDAAPVVTETATETTASAN